MSYREKLSWTLTRFTRFLKIFMRNKRGVLGIIVLFAFIFMALTANLWTPTAPTVEYVAGDFAVPSWFKYVIPSLKYSENFNMLSNPGFPTATSLQDDWNITTNQASLSTASVSVAYDATMGDQAPGSVAITLTRGPGEYSGDIAEIHLMHQFYYPYSGPPKRFTGTLSWYAEGIEGLQQVEMALFIHRIEPSTSQVTTYPLWITNEYKSATVWQDAYPAIDAYDPTLRNLVGAATQDPSVIIFKPQQSYIYDLRIKLTDSDQTIGRIQATIHLDDLNVKFYGTSYGVLGTDYKGRDIFAQLLVGSRISLFVGLLSAVLSVVIGLAVGLIAGYLGTVVDEVVMRLTDMLLVLPGLPLLIVMIAVLGPTIFNLILMIGLLGWMGFARVVRSSVLSLKERPFVEAAKAVGAGKFHIIIRHILPNVMSLVYVTLALSVPSAILSEAALSYLGLFDPNVFSWGRMLNEAFSQNGIEKWWWTVPPGVCIALVSLSFVLLGYSLDEILNPKLRQRQ
jgi:ABC-type dipeptide/oligopeptide/nickel transport system permease subunit